MVQRNLNGLYMKPINQSFLNKYSLESLRTAAAAAVRSDKIGSKLGQTLNTVMCLTSISLIQIEQIGDLIQRIPNKC